MSRSNAARQRRLEFRSTLRTLLDQRDALADRDLRPEARQREQRRLEVEMRELYDAERDRLNELVRAARADLAAMTPSAQRRDASFRDPGRVTAMIGMLAHVGDGELLEYARLAEREGDDAAASAIIQAIAGREQLDRAIADEVTTLLNRAPSGLERSVADAVVTAAEAAGMALDLAEAVGNDDALLRNALAAGHAATSLELDGRKYVYSADQLTGMFQLVQVDQALEVTAWPEPSPGGVFV